MRPEGWQDRRQERKGRTESPVFHPGSRAAERGSRPSRGPRSIRPRPRTHRRADRLCSRADRRRDPSSLHHPFSCKSSSLHLSRPNRRVPPPKRAAQERDHAAVSRPNRRVPTAASPRPFHRVAISCVASRREGRSYRNVRLRICLLDDHRESQRLTKKRQNVGRRSSLNHDGFRTWADREFAEGSVGRRIEHLDFVRREDVHEDPTPTVRR